MLHQHVLVVHVVVPMVSTTAEVVVSVSYAQMTGHLLLIHANRQTRTALQFMWSQVLSPVQVQLFLAEQRQHANVAHEPRLNSVSALNVIVQIVRRRESIITVGTCNAKVFVHQPDMAGESFLAFEFFVTLRAMEVVGIAVRSLVLIQRCLDVENHPARFAMILHGVQVPPPDVEVQIPFGDLFLLTVRTSVLV